MPQRSSTEFGRTWMESTGKRSKQTTCEREETPDEKGGNVQFSAFEVTLETI
jgi:hypothetical protein